MDAIGNNVIIDITEHFKEVTFEEKKTKSGLIITALAQENEYNEKKGSESQIIDGVIISITPEAAKEIKLYEGDAVLISRFFGSKYDDEETNKSYAIIHYNTILAKK